MPTADWSRSPPRQNLPIDLLSQEWDLAPGESRSVDMVLSALYTFAEPGEYEVGIQSLHLSHELSVAREASANVTVLPLDEARLARRCQRLFEEKEAGDDIPWAEALQSVRHDAVLPYLAELAGWQSYQALLAIGSPGATEIINDLAAKSKNLRERIENARNAPPLYPHRWPEGILCR